MDNKSSKHLSFNQAIGLYIRHQRENQGMTRDDIANVTGLSINGIEKIEKGKGRPFFSSVMALCEAIGIDANELQRIYRDYHQS
ncbi:helix-turn-helix domain-containing protein [Gracilibacillus xinjiangensis]|uniref:Helix-turn-helix domain-containing protein n=1 Tax=Gracilibacillus xinjiangensis TaxID=1193282 RepID=A0ABV8WT12_9BACI